jgi:hypothetical protein
MLIGADTGNLIQLVTASGGASITAKLDVISVDTSNPPGVQGTEFNTAPPAAQPYTTAATFTLLAGAASRIKRIMTGVVRNEHASATETVTIQYTDGTDTTIMAKAVLLAGEWLQWTGGAWIHYDANGGMYPSVGNAATQAEMEGGTATNKYVTPEGMNWHPGVAKAWVKAGVTGNILASWNITSLTDTGTGVLTITIATDFSSVEYCAQVSVEATATTWAVANTRECHIRSATIAVGSIAVDCVDNTATTSLVKDPTTWHVVMFGDQ